MRFTPTPLAGAWVIDIEPRSDERGFFARAFCAQEFEEHGIDFTAVQSNLSHNNAPGTLRGLHYQDESAPEAKLVRCIRGALFDVIVDMRPQSPTYRQWHGVELSADDWRALYAPPLFAHGYLTLTADTVAFYHVSEFYTPGSERGVRYDDPAIGISWPADVGILSDKDAAWPLLEAADDAVRR